MLHKKESSPTNVEALLRSVMKNRPDNLGGGVLGDGLGSLGDGVLGQLSWKDEPDSGLNLPGGDGRLLGVPSELGGLAGDLLEDVVDEGVHDGHGLGGDSGVGVHLLQHLVDVSAVRLVLPRLVLLGPLDVLDLPGAVVQLQ